MFIKEGYLSLPLSLEIPTTPGEFKTGLMFREELDWNTGMLFVFNEDGDHSFHMKNTPLPLDIAFISREGIIESIKQLTPNSKHHVYAESQVLYALEVNRNWFKRNDVNVGDQVFKSLSEDVEIHDAKGNLYVEIIDIIKPLPMKEGAKCPTCAETPCICNELLPYKIQEATRIPGYNKTGNIIDVYLAWRGKNYMIKTFFPSVKTPSRREVQDQVSKVYPGSKLWSYQVSTHEPGEPLLQIGGRQ